MLEQCLHSVERAISNVAEAVEVWVVDNASGDDSLAQSKKRYPWVHYIENAENVGFARANNQAMRLANGKYVLLLNPDTIIGESTLSNCIQFLEAHGNVGAVGVKMINAYGDFLPESKRGFPSPTASFYKLTGLYKLAPRHRKIGRYYMGWLSNEEPAEIEILAGAFMLMRQKALQKVGILDERFFMYGEDIDLSWRIKLGGYSCYYLPELILHYKGESSALDDLKHLHAFYGAMQLFFDKYYRKKIGSIGRLSISVAIRLRLALAHLIRALKSSKYRQKLPPPPSFTQLLGEEDESLQDLVKRHTQAGRKKDFLVDTTRISYDDLLWVIHELGGQGNRFHLQRGENEPIVSPRS